MTEETLETISAHIYDMLDQLSPRLTYHSIHHTKDVLAQAEHIFLSEKINVPEEMVMLKVAALFHDSGFLHTYDHHEEASCQIARKELPFFGLKQEKIEDICTLIMATKIPQKPRTILAQVLCDADLDYLGRDDFAPISQKLFQEMKNYKRVDSEDAWNRVQVNFLKNHHYFTKTSIHLRKANKQAHLQEIESKLL